MTHAGAHDQREFAQEFDLDTDSLGVDDRAAHWEQGLSQLFGPVEVEFSDEPHTRGRLQSLQLASCTVISIEANAHRARRTPRQLRGDNGEAELMITHQLNGLSVIRQGGHTLLVRPGEFAVTRLDRPSEVIINGHHERIAVTLPVSVLEPIVGDVDALPASTISASDGPARVLRSVLEGFYFNRALLGPFDRLSAGTFVRDLIGAMLRDYARLPLGIEDRALTDALGFIEHNLRDPALTPAVVAASHFMSVRSLQLLFQPHGWTPSGWIRHRRMQHARHELSTADSSVTVSDIAQRWGFTDLAGFSRLFRKLNGVSPRDYRREVREGGSFARSLQLTNTEDFFREGPRS
ncbi:MAG: helix-turn-helix domain-containing protein [Leucobacter sp.]|nr:helix-turn-helix domain-containing protein [Leucobacter sp.]